MTLSTTALALLIAAMGLGGVLLGAMVAGAFALLTGWLDNRRDRSRWERDKRYDAYTRYLSQVDIYLWMVRADTLQEKAEQELLRELQATLSELRILGPDVMYETASAIHEASSHWLLRKDKPGSAALESAMAAAKSSYVRASRDVLRIQQ